MLDTDLKQQLQAYLSNLRLPIELKAYLDSSSHSSDMDALLQEIAEMSSLIVYTKNTTTNDKRVPSFDIVRTNTAHSINFAAIPMGHEFTSLVLALLHMGGHPPKIDESDKNAILQIETEQHYEVFMSLSCQNCPDVVQALNTMASINPKIFVTTIDGALFQEEVEKKEIMAVPTVYRNGEILFQGRSSLTEILAFLNESSDADKQELYNAKEPFDVLIVGGGPAGAAAGIYAARKGIRTGILTDRFGGQVLDTLSIENYISVPETEGPRLAADLERHTKVYDVDIMKPVKASALKPGNGHHQVVLDNGATLSAKTIILATGARWREMSVPGEQEYRNRGVAYCPHCDGPLFKGKKVSVIGGGNSGVEAAIDLAGIVEHVTLLEFASTLRADDVLQRKLRSLPNVTIITNAQTTEVLGNGQKVSGLKYTDRATNAAHELILDGIFVQIGLIPNTEWLKGVLQLSKTGEIEIDMKGQTSIPGIFAAGDNTTVPYKQIIIAAGEGSKAALSAFDYLIRQNI